MTDLDKLEALAKAATPGPWEVENDFVVTLDPVENDMERRALADARYFHMPRAEANAAFMAAANPATILDLISSARRDAEEIERLRVAIEGEKLNYDGALSDLESALQVLARRINGEKDLDSARTWLELNYPDFAASALIARAAHTGEG